MTEILGRYEILEEIGQGGFAVVYRAHDRQLDRLVALKELRPILLSDPDSVKDFHREAKNIARLDHPNVVTIYDVYEAEQRLFIVMQLVDGSSLAEQIGKRGRLSWSETVELITAMAAGLDYAHSQEILHRDLKPANILLDSNHGPILSDFGLAKLIGEAGASVTAAGGVVGTPHYIAPEVWEGRGTTRQSDIYALGCILYEMLIGEKLFPGETPPAAMMAHFRPLALPNTWPEGVPPSVADVLTTALAQKPATRYATASDMAEALTTLVKRELVTPQLENAKPETELVSPSILTTKLYISPPRPEFVPRPRLTERLNAGLKRKLTLISAPAGFGKTTLASEWIAGCERIEPTIRTAWLSLDEGDNDPVRFLAYVVAALQTIEGNIGKGALSALQSPQPPPTEAILTSLLNEITAIPDRLILVLDDYHLIEAQPIHDALTFLLRRLPPQVHLVIATREDPPLPLARLRARSQLTELRAADLRFTPTEAVEFLNQAMGLNLSTEDITTLETRTEGWIAGLQLAAISMQGQADTTNFIKSFTGSHRFVLDYLVEEVLEQQSESVQSFLLQTSILDRLTGSLCDAVTGQDSGQQILEYLEQANLLVVPLDDTRQWYRYHHLFADVLQARLMKQQPNQVASLHQRASAWYEQNGFIDEAIEHALRGEDFEQAAHLIEEQVDAISEHTRLLRWLDALPVKVILSKPHLCIFHARHLFTSGKMDEAEERLQAAEQTLDLSCDPATGNSLIEPGSLSDSDRMKIQGRVAVIRAFLAVYHGDAQETIDYARQALDYLPEQDLTWRSAAALPLGDAYMFKGDIAAAYDTRLEALEMSKKSGHPFMILINNGRLAWTLRQQGKLKQVIHLCEQQMQYADECGISQTLAAGWLETQWAEALAELDDLDGAVQKAKKGVESMGSGSENLAAFGWSNLYLVKILFSKGDMAGAKEVIQTMEKIVRDYDMHRSISIQISAWQARIGLEENELEVASKWVEELCSDANGKLPFLSEIECIALTRTLIAQESVDEATKLLRQLLVTAKAGQHTSRMIKILILQALALQAEGDTDQAITALEKALTLAKPGGFIRTFVDEGPPMARLLHEALNRGIASDYTRRLLAAFPATEPEQIDSVKTQTATSELIEPLSERELEVLQLMAEGLTNPEVASRLFLALNTVKTHTRNIYGKLNVHNRTQAIACARALGLLPRS